MTTDRRRDRLHPEGPLARPSRSPFAEDRDRILTSNAFWRLRHVTQVMTPSAPGQFHNRLSHSLEVARIGRRIAATLLARPGGTAIAEAAGGLDSDVVEAACLAHDLGHPPFGHDAEDELDRALTAAGIAGGFEANAQSFRIVTKLAQQRDGSSGLNLTRATTTAILKYPWTRDESPMPGKWGVYESEEAELAWARAPLPAGMPEPSLEAAIMDLADLIAYAVHDFEDFVCADLIPLQRLGADATERDRFLGLVAARRSIPVNEQNDIERSLDRLLIGCPRTGRAAIEDYTASRIGAALEAVSLIGGRTGDSALAIARDRELEIFLLEGLTWHYVIDSDLLHPQRDEQRRIIHALFDALADAALTKNDRGIISEVAHGRLLHAQNDGERLRVVADTIASMTEEEALATAERLVRRPNPQ